MRSGAMGPRSALALWLLRVVAASTRLRATPVYAGGPDPPRASRGLSDDPIATALRVYLDGSDWVLTSEPIPAPPAPIIPLPNCTHPSPNTGCCFANGVDWHNGINGHGGKSRRVGSAAACCQACVSAGEANCYVAVYLNKVCYLKTRKDAAGGNITALHPGTVSCMPKAATPKPPPPPLPPYRINGTVPGDLITDLEAAGLIGDPLFENNFLNSSLWSEYLWTYTKTFELPLSDDLTVKPVVVVSGIKMGARVSIDGQVVGNTTNQFRRYMFPFRASAGHIQHTIRITLDPRIDVNGRFMGCSGTCFSRSP